MTSDCWVNQRFDMRYLAGRQTHKPIDELPYSQQTPPDLHRISPEGVPMCWPRGVLAYNHVYLQLPLVSRLALSCRRSTR